MCFFVGATLEPAWYDHQLAVPHVGSDLSFSICSPHELVRNFLYHAS
jgi:hypothetical protein